VGRELSIEGLLALAFAQGPAPQANQLIHDVRGQVAREQGKGFNYEVVLTGRSSVHLLRVVAPRLALYLKGKRMGVEDCGPVFLSVFWHETLHFVRARDFFELVREGMGLDEEAFVAVTRRWAETGVSSAGALPPG
jgi:hypothetical protein